jgi:hypothetical protein
VRRRTSADALAVDDLGLADMVLEPVLVLVGVELLGDGVDVEAERVDHELTELDVLVVSGQDLGELVVGVGEQADVDRRVTWRDAGVKYRSAQATRRWIAIEESRQRTQSRPLDESTARERLGDVDVKERSRGVVRDGDRDFGGVGVVDAVLGEDGVLDKAARRGKGWKKSQ